MPPSLHLLRAHALGVVVEDKFTLDDGERGTGEPARRAHFGFSRSLHVRSHEGTSFESVHFLEPFGM